MAIKSQGTKLYFIDTDGTELLQVSCPTNITLSGSTKDQLEDTCLEDLTDKSFVAGLGTPGPASFSAYFDPSSESHVRLLELQATGEKITWIVGYSDGTAPPTLNSAGGAVLPTTRTFSFFDGYVSEAPITIESNALVTIDFTIQVSGAVETVPKTT